MRVSSGATVAAMWNTVKFMAAAPHDASGQPVLSRVCTNTDLEHVATV